MQTKKKEQLLELLTEFTATTTLRSAAQRSLGQAWQIVNESLISDRRGGSLISDRRGGVPAESGS